MSPSRIRPNSCTQTNSRVLPNADIPCALRFQYQWRPECGFASAFESIAKLSGLLDPAEFPLQKNAHLQKFGIGDWDYLEDIGFSRSEEWFHSIETAAETVLAEVRGGHSSLIVLQLFAPRIFLALHHVDEAMLVDIEARKPVARGELAMKQFLENCRADYMDARDCIQIVSFTPPTN